MISRRSLRHERGFTLIELMIVVAIIGILASVAIPKFADLVRKAREGATKGELGAMRSALAIYYGKMEGIYPETLSGLVSEFIDNVASIRIDPYFPESSSVSDLSTHSSTTLTSANTGGWAYWNDMNDGAADWGDLWIACTHTDTKGNLWTSY